MQIVDAIITREGGNSAWVNVVFIGAHGEHVSVRLPSTVPCGGPLARNRILGRAAEMLRSVAVQAPRLSGQDNVTVPRGRFGMAAEEPRQDPAALDEQ